MWQQRQHRAVVRRGVHAIARSDEDTAAGAYPVGEQRDPFGRKRRDVREHDDVEVTELDLGGRVQAARFRIDPGELFGRDRMDGGSTVFAIAGA